MKNFLKKLQNVQDECLENLKVRAEEINLGKVSGTLIRVADGINFESWQEIRKNIKNHFSDQKRFKEDSGKVIIEKNFLLNSLKLQKGIFVFRPLNDDGKTYLEANQDFLGSRPAAKSLWHLLLLLVIIPCIFLGFWVSPYYFLGLIFLPIMIWLNNLSGKREKEEQKKWIDSFMNNPDAILSESMCSGPNKPGEKQLQSFVKINLLDSPFYDDYKKILHKTVDIACQTKGRIAWLWCYDEQVADDFAVSYSDYNSYGTKDRLLNIKINILTSNIMPVVETEASFIFCFENFSAEMNTYEEGILFAKLKHKIKDQLNGYYKDDMFKIVI